MSLIIEPIMFEGVPIAFEGLLSKAFDIHGSVRSCVMNAMERGGYVAGGLARQILRVGKFNACPNSVSKSYLGLDQKPDDWYGDIDIFFPNNDAYFSAELSNAFTAVNRTPYYDTFRPNKDAVSVQYIKGRMLSIEAMLDSFDITNGKVAFDRHNVYYDDRWMGIENIRQLHVDKFTRVKTMLRVCRWRVRHNLWTLHPETRIEFNTLLNNLMSQCSNVDEIVGTDAENNEISIKNLYDSLAQHRPYIDNETLMSMWLLVGNLIGKERWPGAIDYVSWAEGELNKRAGHINRNKGEVRF